MLDQTFLQLLNMSYTASFAILFILLARIALQKAPKRFSYLLWSVALFRLICPWSFESSLSMLAIAGKTADEVRPFLEQYVPLETVSGGAVPFGTATVSPHAPYGALEPTPQHILTALWLIGIVALLVFNLVALLRLKKRLADSVHDTDNIYSSKKLSTPFVMGVIRPKIYLPAFLSGPERQYVLLHEQTHIRRLDHIIRLVSFLVLCIHWFNPLVWAAFFLSGKDMEMSCDEVVIHKLGSGVKQKYSLSILSLATGRRFAGSTLLSFSQGDVKGRINNVLHYKKPAFYVIAVGLTTVVALCAGLALNPVSANALPSALKTIFTLDQKDGSYQIVEKSVQDASLLFSCSNTSVQPEDVLTEKMGFPVHFPDLLNGKYVCVATAEGLGIKKQVSFAAWQEIVPNAQKAIYDEAAYQDLKEYAPYRCVTGYYGYHLNTLGLISIDIMAKKDSVQKYNAIEETKTKVGDKDAKWLKTINLDPTEDADGKFDLSSAPKGVVEGYVLIWDADGIQYALQSCNRQPQLSMDDAVTLAESFMAGQ